MLREIHVTCARALACTRTHTHTHTHTHECAHTYACTNNCRARGNASGKDEGTDRGRDTSACTHRPTHIHTHPPTHTQRKRGEGDGDQILQMLNVGWCAAPPVANLVPSGGMPPSTSDVATAGGALVSPNAAAPACKAASDASPVPPQNAKAVLHGTGALPLATKSTLNPWAKEWTPGGAPKEMTPGGATKVWTPEGAGKTATPTAAATSKGPIPAGCLKHGNTGPAALPAPPRALGQGSPSFKNSNVIWQERGAQSMGPGHGQGSGGRCALMGSNGLVDHRESSGPRLQTASPGLPRTSRNNSPVADLLVHEGPLHPRLHCAYA
jgi:hypothetical protein